MKDIKVLEILLRTLPERTEDIVVAYDTTRECSIAEKVRCCYNADFFLFIQSKKRKEGRYPGDLYDSFAATSVSSIYRNSRYMPIILRPKVGEIALAK